MRLADTCEGFVSLRDTGEYFVLDAARRVLFGSDSGVVYRLGAKVRVRISSVYPYARPRRLRPCAPHRPGSSPESNALFLARLFSSRRRGILKFPQYRREGPSCFLRESLSHMCAPRFLHRRRSIAAGGRSVYDRRVRYDGESTIINAVVASQTSSTEGYRVMVELNGAPISSKITPVRVRRRFQYDGMCKHAVALALDYVAHSDSYAGFRPRSFCRIFRLHRRVHGARRTPRA